eukprot:m.100137 g.100137  ORF g.100137 m.100137 type:complete len:816 (+) comp13693_c0_seq9:225-2672(+)
MDASNPKRTWTNLRDAVGKVQENQMLLANINPNNVSFLGENVLYLGCRRQVGKGNLQELLTIKLGGGQASSLTPRPLLAADWIPGSARASNSLSKEDILLRERQRQFTTGITSYVLHYASEQILFPYAGRLFVCKPKTDAPVYPTEIVTSHKGARLHPEFCPMRPEILSYVRENDIWITSNNVELQITAARASNADLSAGVPSYIVQEEFDRISGYWWQPKSSNMSVQRILYEKVDESPVDQVVIPEFSTDGDVETLRFPRPGCQNPLVELCVVEMEIISDSISNTKLRHKKLPVRLSSAFPWCEYVVRCGWIPSGTHIWIQILNRVQERLAIVFIPLDVLVEDVSKGTDQIPLSSEDDSVAVENFLDKCFVVLEETSKIWINITNTFLFWETKEVEDIIFIWASQATGYSHLELVACSLKSSKKRVRRFPITKGEWEVENSQVYLDVNRNAIYFTSTKDTPLELHFYYTRLLNEGSFSSALESTNMKWSEPQRLTEKGFTHRTYLHVPSLTAVDFHSSLEMPTKGYLAKIEEHATGLSRQADPFFVHPEMPLYIPPEQFTFRSKHGHDVHGHVYRPTIARNEPNAKCPTLLYLYGGPHVQLVSNEYRAVRNIRLNLCAMMGFTVVVMDCRGSKRRGLDFEAHYKKNMGSFEIDDQVEGLQFLISEGKYNIDEKRIGIHGWSYGGYLALMGLAQRPDVFKVAVAGAPVSQWELYDTAYTERYMGLPEVNDSEYDAGNVVKNIEAFPDSPNRLLLVHGLIDENVHFHHTATLIEALINAGKPHSLQVYPKERHGIRAQRARVHFETTLLWFLQEHL